ncbi:hypothetical protein [Mesorhizobium sp.]|uniref:hypothetical protein n=1 Tax=Mesorhizobium sp. TaxID=1871066 RepID=UPI00120F35B3|nr:hypothetical protein [Mesorhizobium sp.]TIN24029.1 MAG: hypothetical protein E5Y19_24190 [Mesorhizobium sp.]
MTFTESNAVEAHLRDILAGAASARPAQFSPRLARMGGNRIAGLGWHYVAPVELHLFGIRSSSVMGLGRQM